MIHIYKNHSSIAIQYICVLLIILVLQVFLACSGANPVIYKLDTQLQVYWKYPNAFQERFLVQILADDDDGFDEIYEIYVIHDKSELYWRITKDEWDLVEEEGNEWIVLNNIVGINSENLPRGEYRIVLLDFSGYRDEQSVYLKQPSIMHTQSQFPKLVRQADGEYLPQFDETKLASSANPLILELAHSKLREQEKLQEIVYFGKTSEFFEIANNKTIKFVLNQNARSRLFIHHLNDDGILYSSGPYTVQFRTSY